MKWTNGIKEDLTPFGKKDNNLHMVHFLVIGYPRHGRFLYNNDCHMVEDYHINFHRRTVIYQSKPSDSRVKRKQELY